MARVNLAHFRPAAVDHDAIARDPLGRGLFDGEVERQNEDMSESERNERLLASGLAETRALPVDEALERIRATREAVKYGHELAPQRVIVDALEEATLSRAAREAQEQA